MAIQYYLNAYPATRGVVIAFSDTVDTTLYKALYFSESGVVKLFDSTATALTLTVVAGTVLPLQSRGIWSTGTAVTAGSIIGLYD